MKNNYIGIDISLNSTAVFIQNGIDTKILSFTNKKDNNIYIKELEANGVNFYFIYRETNDEYSKNEILKIKSYDDLSEKIVLEIILNLDTNKKTFCQIEGYSYASKNTSSLLDIVALSTLIKIKLFNKIPNIDISIISPSTLKLEACKLVYKPIDVGKKKPKLEYRNNNGLSGGSFKKPEMFQAMVDGNIDTPILNMLKNYIHLVERKKIPNPIEDIIDSIFACKSKIKEIEDIVVQ